MGRRDELFFPSLLQCKGEGGELESSWWTGEMGGGGNPGWKGVGSGGQWVLRGDRLLGVGASGGGGLRCFPLGVSPAWAWR